METLLEPTVADIGDWEYHRRIDMELTACPICGAPLPCPKCLNDLRCDG